MSYKKFILLTFFTFITTFAFSQSMLKIGELTFLADKIERIGNSSKNGSNTKIEKESLTERKARYYITICIDDDIADCITLKSLAENFSPDPKVKFGCGENYNVIVHYEDYRIKGHIKIMGPSDNIYIASLVQLMYADPFSSIKICFTSVIL